MFDEERPVWDADRMMLVHISDYCTPHWYDTQQNFFKLKQHALERDLQFVGWYGVARLKHVRQIEDPESLPDYHPELLYGSPSLTAIQYTDAAVVVSNRSIKIIKNRQHDAEGWNGHFLKLAVREKLYNDSQYAQQFA